MNVIPQAMMYLLNLLHSIVGNYGLAIILLTILIRVVLWPLNTAQTRSMRKMQELQPKMKALQDKYKDNPQKMQEELMKFYSQNSFNPMAGCLPMLVQLPIFIGLYGALSSPQFLADTIHERFLFLDNLSHTLYSHAGDSLDGKFSLLESDTFAADKTIRLTMNDSETREHEAPEPNQVISAFSQVPKPGQTKPLFLRTVQPGKPLTFTLSFKHMGLNEDYRHLVKEADVLVINNQSRELERVHFTNVNGKLVSTPFPTIPAKDNPVANLNQGLLILIVIYGALTLLYQKVMTGQMPQPAAGSTDPATAAMQGPMMKMMPLLFVVMMFFIPIPAGAMIYLVVTTALMLIQTVWVNANEDKKGNGGKPSSQIIDVKADQA